MKIVSVVKDSVTVEVLYSDISLMTAALTVPNHAFAAPNFEREIGASQADVDELDLRLRSELETRSDYREYRQLSWRTNTREQQRPFKMNLPLSKDDIVLLGKAFKEAVKFTREKDDFHIMTGFFVEEAETLQLDLDEIVKKIGNQQ